MHFLSLTQCAEEIGMTRAGIYKKLIRDGFPTEKGDNGEIQVNASMFHGKYTKEIAAHKLGVSKSVSKNDNGNNGKQAELEAKDKEIEGLKNQLFERNQRLNDLHESTKTALAAKEETIQTLRLLSDQRAEQAKQLPPEVVEKMAALEAENRLLKDNEEQRKERLQQARQAAAEAEAAAAARPWWKKIVG